LIGSKVQDDRSNPSPRHERLAADRAFPGSAYAHVAKIGVWACSVFAALFGVLTLLLSPPAVAEARRADCQLPMPANAVDNNAGVGKN